MFRPVHMFTMANTEAKKIAMKLDEEYERLKARIAPKMQKRARGRLRKIKRYTSRLKPLRAKEYFVSVAENDIKAKLARVGNQISQAKKKSASDKARVVSLTRELKGLRKEIPQLNKSVRMWSSNERKMAGKHRSIRRDLGNLQKRIAREEKRKDKVAKALQKYFQ